MVKLVSIETITQESTGLALCERQQCFLKNKKIVNTMFEIDSVKINESFTMGHKHIIVKFKNAILTEQEKLFFQVVLGSDPTRELLGYARLFYQLDVPTTCFFEKEND